MTAAAFVLPSAAPATPARDTVIRMGKGIGKVDLGMTVQQVRRALGGPHFSVIRRLDFGAQGRYLELGWELPGRRAWEPVAWDVGFRSSTRNGRLRVVRIHTNAVSERTRERLGVGSRPRQLVSAYPRAECVRREYELPWPYDWVVVDDRQGGMTAFLLYSLDIWENRDNPNMHKVVAVMVQRDWFSKGPGHRSCPRGWERW